MGGQEGAAWAGRPAKRAQLDGGADVDGGGDVDMPQAADSDEDEWGSSGEDAADEPEEAEDDADAAADPIGERACRSHRAPLIGAAYFWLGLAAAFWSYASIGAPRSSSDGGPSVLQILPVRATLGQHRLSGLTGQRA